MLKAKLAKAIAAAAKSTAKQACGAASFYGIHQADEPKAVRDFFSKKADK